MFHRAKILTNLKLLHSATEEELAEWFGDDLDDVKEELEDMIGEGLVESEGGIIREKTYKLTRAGEAEAIEVLDTKRNVFLVHGHEHVVLRDVQALLAGEFRDVVEVVVLMDEPSRGNESLYDKFQRHADEGDYAVVLLTADDVGAARREGAQRARARQNAVMELGYFLRGVGRERVFILIEGGVEEPSDIRGGMVISLDGQWKHELCRDLRAALEED